MSDCVPQPIWAKLFLGDQGYVLQENIVYQDNQSSMDVVEMCTYMLFSISTFDLFLRRPTGLVEGTIT